MKCTFISKLSLVGDQIHGYVDIGFDEMENVVATQALVLMVVAINESWKNPIAYFLIKQHDKSRESTRHLREPC